MVKLKVPEFDLFTKSQASVWNNNNKHSSATQKNKMCNASSYWRGSWHIDLLFGNQIAASRLIHNFEDLALRLREKKKMGHERSKNNKNNTKSKFNLKVGENAKGIINQVGREVGSEIIGAGERGGLDNAFEAKLQKVRRYCVLIHSNPAKPVPLHEKLQRVGKDLGIN